MKFFGNKGQGTTEYLIILAVIIVIALVVAGVMGWFPGMSSGIGESQSKAYWSTTSPIAIDNWKIASTGAMFTLKNVGTNKLIVTDMNVNGVVLNLADITLTAGSTATTTESNALTCVTGEPFSYDVVITYDVENGIAGNKLTGSKQLAGTCQ
jgi:uncharacterized protein (UPF0333 family)